MKYLHLFFCFQVNLSELKAFPNPPDAVTNVTAAVMVLLANKGKVPKDRTWKAAKLFMGKVLQHWHLLKYIFHTFSGHGTCSLKTKIPRASDEKG